MSLKNLLAELQRDYLESIPTKIANIQLLWSERRNGDLRALQTEFHKLKGTGRTYGLPEISQLGEALETLCEEKHESLETVVTLASRVLESIRTSRESGVPYPLENDRDFQVIIEFVMELSPRKAV